MNNILDLSVLDDFFVFLCERETLLKSELVRFWPQTERNWCTHKHHDPQALFGRVWARMASSPCIWAPPVFMLVLLSPLKKVFWTF